MIGNRKSNFWDTICNPKLITDQNDRKSDIENRISEIKKRLVVRCAICAWSEDTIAALGGASGGRNAFKLIVATQVPSGRNIGNKIALYKYVP